MRLLQTVTLAISVACAVASSCHPDYECCRTTTKVEYSDSDGNWGIENNNWCLMKAQQSTGCKFEAIGYQCCSHCNTIYTDSDGNWGVENNDWCGIRDNCSTDTPTTTSGAAATTQGQQGQGPTDPNNFFTNTLYSNSAYQKQVQSSADKLSGELRDKALKVKNIPTAVWLAWDGAAAEVPGHLAAAGSTTPVFILYMVPNRDCNSQASAGGVKDLASYQAFVDSIYSSFAANPDKKIVMVIEPDTLGNLVTAGDNPTCRNNQELHKNCMAYALNKFGSLSNVQVYLDAAHNRWLNNGNLPDKAASIIKEIMQKAPNGKLRGISTNISNYRPVSEEYQYHKRLDQAFKSIGVNGLKYIVDTGRSGVVTNSNTWCNLIGTGLGLRPQGNPDPNNMPLLDAYMWLKPPGEADGSSQGSRADPVCANADSLQTSPDAGSWFHEYFVQLVKNANPAL